MLDPRTNGVGAGGIILAASLISGLCGLGYEVILVRALHTVLGHTTAVAAATIASFLLALAAGAWLGARAQSRLAWVETAGAILAAGFGALLLLGPGALAPAAAGLGPVGAVVVAVVCATPLALVAGVAIPAYTLRLGGEGCGRSRAFARIYVLYNAVAAAGVLSLEVAVVPMTGLGLAMLALAGANGLAALLVARHRAPGRTDPVMTVETAPERGEVLAVVLTGVAGGIAQVAAIMLANLLFGPLGAHPAYAMALALAGLSVGTVCVRAAGRRPWAGMGVAAVAAGLGVTSLSWWIGVWPDWLAGSAGPWHLVGVKSVILAGLLLPLFGAVGASVPAVLARRPGDAGTPGRLLAVAAVGNAAGALAAVLGLNAAIGPSGLFALAFGLIALAVFLLGGRIAAPIAALSGALALALWPGFELAHPARDLAAGIPAAQPQRGAAATEQIRAYDRVGHILRYPGGGKRVTMDGDGALYVPPGGLSPAETLVGLVGLREAPAPRRSLVLGLGTGITASTVAAGASELHVVDSSPLAPAIARRFSRENGGFMRRDGWTLERADAIQVLSRVGPAYDLILSTVNSAAFAPAAKIYTREVMAAAAGRLSPDGVFVMWLDSVIPEPARRSIEAAMSEVWVGGCRRYRLSDGYVALACGRDDLAPPSDLNVPAVATIDRKLRSQGWQRGAGALVGALERGTAALATDVAPAQLDPPRLERLMADPRPPSDGDGGMHSAAPIFRGLMGGPEQCPAELFVSPWARCAFRYIDRVCGEPGAEMLEIAASAAARADITTAVRRAGALDTAGFGDRARATLERVAAMEGLPLAARIEALAATGRLKASVSEDARVARAEAILRKAEIDAAYRAQLLARVREVADMPLPISNLRVRSCER